MRMTMAQAMRLDMGIYLRFAGGHTATIFPEVEQWLQEDSDHQSALLYIARGDGWQDRYNSVIDYVYAMAFPQQRALMKRFYLSNKEEDMAKSHITLEERDVMAAYMLAMLQVAYAAFCQKRRASWKQVRQVVSDLAA